jgi:hypothetical protein
MKPHLKLEDFDVTAPVHWHTHATGLQKALDHAGNTHALGDVRQQIRDGDAFWFANPDCAIVMEILRYPRRTVGRVWLATGSLKAIQAVAPYLEEWFRMRGCTRVWILGRPGWQRALKKWHPRGAILELELET